jgi:dTDP-4-dehydrorhamnose 3,5-epimerase
MNLRKTRIPEVVVLEPKLYRDERGFFLESYNQRVFEELGIRRSFVQDNQSRSSRNVLRGLHYQIGKPQGKLVRVVVGSIWDVAVDIRRSSPTFGQWVAEELSEENQHILWIPEGFAHGLLVTSERADVLYKATDFYAPSCERTLLWNDPELAIPWPVSGDPQLSAKDRVGLPLGQAEVFE